MLRCIAKLWSGFTCYTPHDAEKDMCRIDLAFLNNLPPRQKVDMTERVQGSSKQRWWGKKLGHCEEDQEVGNVGWWRLGQWGKEHEKKAIIRITFGEKMRRLGKRPRVRNAEQGTRRGMEKTEELGGEYQVNTLASRERQLDNSEQIIAEEMIPEQGEDEEHYPLVSPRTQEIWRGVHIRRSAGLVMWGIVWGSGIDLKDCDGSGWEWRPVALWRFTYLWR